MHSIKKIIFSLLVISSGAFAAEEAVVKIQPNTTVSYHLDLNADFKQNIDTDSPAKGNVSGNVDLLISLIKEKEFPELVVTLLGFKGLYDADGKKMEIDSKKPNGPDNDLDGLTSFINQPIKLPLTTNRSILTSQSSEYPMLPVPNPDGYISFVQAIMGYITEGATFIKNDGVDLELRFGGSKLTLNSSVSNISSDNVTFATKYNLSVVKNAIQSIPEALVSGYIDIKLDRNNALVHQLEGKTDVSFSNPDTNVQSKVGDNVLKATYSVTSKQLSEKEAAITKPATPSISHQNHGTPEDVEPSDDL